MQVQIEECPACSKFHWSSPSFRCKWKQISICYRKPAHRVTRNDKEDGSLLLTLIPKKPLKLSAAMNHVNDDQFICSTKNEWIQALYC